MKNIIVIQSLLILISFLPCHGQDEKFIVGYCTISTTDSSRHYFPDSMHSTSMRPIDLDIFYPASQPSNNQVLFGDFLTLFEQRANRYQNETNFTGIREELLQQFAHESELESVEVISEIKTNTYLKAPPSPRCFPLILYFAGLNGMAFENYPLLEKLASNGFVVVSISSIGRYPGDMTNHPLDMMEQVLDAEFALHFLSKQGTFTIDTARIGVLGYSWGGMSAATFATRNSTSAFVSLDGSETHYFGFSAEEDSLIAGIQRCVFKSPKKSPLTYLFMESGDRFSDFKPTGKYHYFDNISTPEKYYLHFVKSKHENFSCLKSMGQAHRDAGPYEQVSILTLGFFQKCLQYHDKFKDIMLSIKSENDISLLPPSFQSSNKTIRIWGHIQDERTRKPLPFASIGLLHQELGTISNDSGIFHLTIPEALQDTIKISMIGYTPKTFTVSAWLAKQSNIVTLIENDHQLNEVVIVAKGLTKIILGNKTTSKFISTAFGYDQLGAEMGIKINVRHNPTYVDAFHFHISYNRLRMAAWFRINIYSIKNGKPFVNLLQHTILKKIDAQQTGIVSVDLKDFNIVLKEDVIVTLEWIKTEGIPTKGEAIYFSLGAFNGGTFLKRSSQGQFKKFTSMGVGMNLEGRY